MSRHHTASGHNRDAPKVRRHIAATLPRPCVECGRPITVADTWHVGHIIPASKGGRTTVNNCGPVHPLCNQRAGARLSTAKLHGNGDGIREW